MVKRKVCMIGAPGVGKTSLVRRFVERIFSERYHSTIGVRIDQKTLTVDGAEVVLVLWDLAGADHPEKLPVSYLRGAAGYLLVMDGTGEQTVETAMRLHERVAAAAGPIPFLALVNKSDLVDDWKVDTAGLARRGWAVRPTSAKTGSGVEEAFGELARLMVSKPPA